MEAEQLSAPKPEHETERRDIQQIISLWQRNASEDGGPPLLSTFDLSKMKAKRDHRFLICSDQTVQNAAFIVYGQKFAQLLGLPDKMTRVVSLYQLIPGRYRPIFAEGCGAVMNKDKPAQFSGTFDHEFRAELFRAVFVPIRLHPKWTKRLILGSLNCRFRPADKRAI
jgi:hypothetical protein